MRPEDWTRSETMEVPTCRIYQKAGRIGSKGEEAKRAD